MRANFSLPCRTARKFFSRLNSSLFKLIKFAENSGEFSIEILRATTHKKKREKNGATSLIVEKLNFRSLTHVRSGVMKRETRYSISRSRIIFHSIKSPTLSSPWTDDDEN